MPEMRLGYLIRSSVMKTAKKLTVSNVEFSQPPLYFQQGSSEDAHMRGSNVTVAGFEYGL